MLSSTSPMCPRSWRKLDAHVKTKHQEWPTHINPHRFRAGNAPPRIGAKHATYPHPDADFVHNYRTERLTRDASSHRTH
jgi:hypothetical protein